MTSDPSPPAGDSPVYHVETDTRYSIEVIAELAGVHPKTVLHYQEQGFIRPTTTDTPGETALFDIECLRQLRRIEHLRATCQVNDTGLKLILDLLHEIECLREERRQQHR